MLAVGVLGPVAVWRGDTELGLRGARQRALVAALALDGGQVVRTDVLAERVWGEAQPLRPENALQQQVFKLRRLLGEDAVVFEPPGYRLALDGEAVDVVRFEGLLRKARREDRGPTDVIALLDEALSLWRGAALADFVYESWAAVEAGRLEELRLQAHELRAAALLRAGREADAIVELRPQVGLRPPRERSWALLMLALYRDGRQAEALAAYADARDALVTELGIEPGTELRTLHDRMLQQDPALHRGPGSPGSGASAATERTLPGALARHHGAGAFVGRDSELERLSQVWTRATSGRLGSVFVAGDPGVGKTRLVAEHAHVVAADGGRVAYARADEEISAPYGLFISALGQLLAVVPPDVLHAHVTAHGGELARLVPGLSTRVPGLPPLRMADPDTERFRLHEAVVAFVTAAADRDPILLVLEDIHWADHASLTLLSHLLAGPDAPLQVVAIYRGTVIDQREPLRTLLPSLLRGPETEPLNLEGLREDDVVWLLSHALGRPAADAEAEIARRIHHEAGGNALFVTELLRSLMASGTLEAQSAQPVPFEVPATVRELIGDRLAQIGPRAADALLPATVIGASFEAGVLARLTGLGDEELLDLLDRAREASLIVENREAAGFSFSHAVIRTTLGEALGLNRRRLLERRLAGQLAGTGTSDARTLGQIARLWIDSGDREQGRQAALRAGDAAIALLAFDAAVSWYREALDLHEADPACDQIERARILIGLGKAERQAGSDASREHLLEAGRIARAHGDARLLTSAALANNRGMHSHTGSVDHERLELLEAASDLPGSDQGEQALLLATTSSELWYGDHDRRHALSDQALALARGAGDPQVLAEVIYRRAFAIAKPATLGERLALTAELVTLTDRLGIPHLRVGASLERSRAAIESGDLDEGLRHAGRVIELAADVGDAFGRRGAGWAKAWPHTLAGRYELAESAAQAALEEAMASDQADALSFYGAQLCVIRWDQGKLGTLADAIAAQAAGPEGLPAHSALAALALAEAGRTGDAEQLLDHFAAEHFTLPMDGLWLTGMVMWGEVCVLCGRPDAAAVLLELLLPWREQVAFTGLAVHGCAARVAAELAALLDRDDADELFACAERVHERLAAPALLARTRAGWARWLAARGQWDRAATLQTRARQSAEACGCPHLDDAAAVP
jgi:DNA-binding SARP family transcriptional activator